MITAPWYEDEVEQLAFNMYAIHESTLGTCIKMLACLDDIDDEDECEAIFERFGLSDLAEDKKNYMIAKAKELMW